MNNGFSKIFYKLWLYHFLKIFTIIYIVTQLLVFHFRFSDIPAELRYFWMISLFCYALIKEVFRWANIPDKNNRNGELYAILVIFSFLWMEFFNIARKWFFNKNYLDLPDGYFGSAVEALALLLSSGISTLFFHCKNNNDCKDNNESLA